MNNLARNLDYSSKEADNVETKGLMDIITEFAENLEDPIDWNTPSIEPIEFRSRSGFIAYDRNRGGIDFIAFSTVANLIGSGSHFGTWIADRVEEIWNDSYDELKKENPGLTDEELSDLNYSRNDDDYSGIAYRVRVMYEGDNTLCIHYGFDLDAPYYRWTGGGKKTIEIKFKNKSDLERKLKSAHSKITKGIEKHKNPTG